jgi:putative flavoprotein involved in K+ transport
MAAQQTYEERGSASLIEAATERFDTIVIGGGQAGLAMGYHLKKQGRPFVILDANERIGGSWRTRTWHSLRLFTPAQFDGLPGWSFPAPRWSFPTAKEVADYLEAYAERFELPVRSGVGVDRSSGGDRTSPSPNSASRRITSSSRRVLRQAERS